MNPKIREALEAIAQFTVPVWVSEHICESPYTLKAIEEKQQLAREALAALDDGWIPVSERLPKYSEPILLCVFGDKLQNPRPYRLEIGSLQFINEEGPQFVSCEYGVGGIVGYVTHWRELPPPPKDKTND